MSEELKLSFIQQILAARIKVLENESSLLGHIMATLTLPRNQEHISATLKLFIMSWKESYDKIQKGTS